MSDQVGFSFQADVVNTASLGHVLTGRLLKALSDGGVDTYATWTAVQLGKRIPVQASHHSSLYAHIMSKKTYQSVLSKALSIGWGHSAPVADLARTVAGTNAIILIGALGTGCQAFAAAQCLSEVMAIYGLEADMRPSVDVLKSLVNYLAPFTQNLGFSKVLEHITTLTERVIRHDGRMAGTGSSQRLNFHLTQLKELGGPAVLARAIKQLIHTAQKGQKDFMAPKMRGTWLPAFASHILGMSVEVRFNQTTVWASAGDHGHCLFQLDDEFALRPGLHPSLQANGIVELEKEGHEGGGNRSSLIVDYAVGEALEAQFLKRPEIDSNVAASIRVGIKCLSFHLLKNMLLFHFLGSIDFSYSGGLLDGEKPLEDVLDKMGIDINSDQQVAPGQEDYLGPFPKSFPEKLEYQGLEFLDLKSLHTLADSCPAHLRNDCSKDRTFEWSEGAGSVLCPCRSVGRLIHCFATTALALMFCNFDAAKVRVLEKVIIGDTMTRWTQDLIMIPKKEWTPEIEYLRRNLTLQVRHEDAFYHLAELICCDYSLHWLEKANASSNIGESDVILGVSGRAFTINYKCVMEHECFDHYGRYMRIQSGRASVAGTFRNVIVEDTLRRPDRILDQIDETVDVVSLAKKTTIEPCYRPPETGITMGAFVREEVISIQLNLSRKTSRPVAVSFMPCMYRLMSSWAAPKCNHEKDRPYTLENDQDVAVSGFHVASLRPREAAEVLVYALRGNTLEQLLVCGLMQGELRLASGAAFAWLATPIIFRVL
ncbi:hypothetical protein CSIM01_09933 [Colletotrichum simmondsii]|uniref:Uncharacterized protein n=1 Tax=Colletotrichum simmondsii TaxID=703756 RepID=A0A135SVZ5_9PEZI|nr:hypothetical protein CSIM01_09933 [Colletotrichum simmondsii]